MIVYQFFIDLRFYSSNNRIGVTACIDPCVHDWTNSEPIRQLRYLIKVSLSITKRTSKRRRSSFLTKLQAAMSEPSNKAEAKPQRPAFPHSPHNHKLILERVPLTGDILRTRRQSLHSPNIKQIKSSSSFSNLIFFSLFFQSSFHLSFAVLVCYR